VTLRYLEAAFPPAVRERRPPEEYTAMQALTRELAFDDRAWTADRYSRVRELFDRLASEWHTRDTEERRVSVRDALERSGVPTDGPCLEVGSGTGLYTSLLADHFPVVISVDLSTEMLRLAPDVERAYRVAADATRLPLGDAAVRTIVCINAYLFPSEYARVLSEDGALLFLSTLGEDTPIYLPPDDVVRALEPALGPVEAACADAGIGRWTVVSRKAAPERKGP
jgi:SAM-dependent methyltransferase